MASSVMIRPAMAVVLGFAALTAAGCSMFGKDSDYALPPEQRPLEVPPPLVLHDTANQGGAVSRSQLSAPAPAAAQTEVLGFTVAGEQQAVYAQIGTLLEAMAGVQITNRAQLLGSYDVSYQGSHFLIRVADAGNGSARVMAMDPRGVAPEGDAAAQLIAQLRAQLANATP